MRRSLLVLVFALLAGVLWFHLTPTAEAQGCVSYSAPFQGYLYGYCYAYPFNGYVFPVNVPFGGDALIFGFTTLDTSRFPSDRPFSAFTFGFPYTGYPPYTGFGGLPGSGSTTGGGSAGGLAYQGFGFPFSGYPFSAGATVTYNGYLFPIFGIPGSVGYNAGSRRGFNPWSTPDAYLKTLDAVD